RIRTSRDACCNHLFQNGPSTCSTRSKSSTDSARVRSTRLSSTLAGKMAGFFVLLSVIRWMPLESLDAPIQDVRVNHGDERGDGDRHNAGNQPQPSESADDQQQACRDE